MRKDKILIIIFCIILIDYIIAKLNKPRIYFVDKLANNYNARTIPPFGIYITNDNKENKKLIEHEIVHWEQYQRNGTILFYIKYFFQMNKNVKELEKVNIVKRTIPNVLEMEIL